MAKMHHAALALLLGLAPVRAGVDADPQVALAPAAMTAPALQALPRVPAVIDLPEPPVSPAPATVAANPRRPAPRLVVPLPAPSPAYRHTFRILLAHPETTDAYDKIVLREARKHSLDPRLIKAIIASESEFQRQATSPRGALGLMQLMPATAEEMGVPASQLQRPNGAIRAGSRYLDRLFQAAWAHYHLDPRTPYSQAPLWVVERVIAAYNAGPRYLYRQPVYRETREYVRKVLLYMESPVSLVRRSPLAAGPAMPVAARTGTLP